MKYVIMLVVFFGIAIASADITGGAIVVPAEHGIKQIELPADFDVEIASAQLRQARHAGDIEHARELHEMLNLWWQQHRQQPADPFMRGNGTAPAPVRSREESGSQGSPAPLWGTDVRIDPNDGVRDVRIASLGNGELYAISTWYDATNWHILVHRSTDNGATWAVNWDYGPAGYSFIDPEIFVSRDTLIESYILVRQSDNYRRTWIRAVVPGPTDNPVYWGSPTGDFQPIPFTSLDVCTDGVIYPDHYLYATWMETYGVTPDSTRVMTAVSQDIDVASWEVGPIVLALSNGGAYWGDTRIAYGSNSDAMWIVADAHPIGYPSLSEAITGWYSDNYGSTWTTYVNLTPFTDAKDQFDPAIAGAHINTNWVVLATEADTNAISGFDVVNIYSTNDGTDWTETGWIAAYEEFHADVWVDNNSNGFYGACLQDRTGGVEHVRYKDGNINDPTAWIASVLVNDNVGGVLSDVYGPAVSYNEGTADQSCIAWSGYDVNYSIWFDTYSGVGVEENTDGTETGFVSLSPNPSRAQAQLRYTTSRSGPVFIALYDISGRLVKEMVNETRPAGSHALSLDHTNLSAGIYFLRVETTDGVATKAMTIVK